MTWIEHLPKIELHCHLDGSLRPSLVRELLAEQGLLCPAASDEMLRQRLQVSRECRSLAEYLEKFDLPLACLQEKSGLYRAAYELMRDVSEENVCYIEVRFAPMLSTEHGLGCREVIACVAEGLKDGEREFGVAASAIVCAMRHHPMEKNLEMLRAAREFLGNGVCALDLAGDEAAFATSGFAELFREAVRLDMPFTIHSGECGSVENVRTAVELGAKRIGHGIALGRDRGLQEVLREKRIGIEMCPTSNLQTKAVDDYSEYPMAEFLKDGLLVTINTDNRTVSGTTLTKETEVAVRRLGLDEAAVRVCMENAVECAFAPDETKHELWRRLVRKL